MFTTRCGATLGRVEQTRAPCALPLRRIFGDREDLAGDVGGAGE